MTLLDLVRSQRIATLEELKKEFRRRSLVLHPDHNGASGHEGFVALRSDYELAAGALGGPGPGGTDPGRGQPPDAPGFLDTFFELTSLGMLDGRQRRRGSKAYLARFHRAARHFDRRPGGRPGDFEGLVRWLTGEDSGPLGGRLRELFHSMLSYRYNAFQYMKARMVAEISALRAGFRDSGQDAAADLIGLLAQELLGPAP